MVKIIEAREVPTKQIRCRNCHSLLEYGNADLNEVFEYNNQSLTYPQRPALKKYYFRCPRCGVEMPAEWISNPIKITEEQFNQLTDEQKALFE